MRLKNPGGIEQAIQTLRQLSAQVGNTMVSGRGIAGARDGWLEWWQQTDAQLRSLFADADLASDLYRAQLEVQRIADDAGPYLHLRRIVDVWQARLDEAVVHLEALRGFIARAGAIVVPDTSDLIEGVGLGEANWHEVAQVAEGELVRLILPVLVIEELDDLKRHRTLV